MLNLSFTSFTFQTEQPAKTALDCLLGLDMSFKLSDVARQWWSTFDGFALIQIENCFTHEYISTCADEPPAKVAVIEIAVNLKPSDHQVVYLVRERYHTINLTLCSIFQVTHLTATSLNGLRFA